MKTKFFIITIIMIHSSSSIAQSMKSVIGNYSKNGENYFIQEDNTFIIVAYATLITGKWTIENSLLKLTPQNPDSSFFLYGFHNPSVVGTKIMFAGFNADGTLIGFNEFNNMQRVFNKGANCTSYPNIHSFKNLAKEISFSYESANINDREREIYTYKIDNDFNDFIAYYNSRSGFYERIVLKIKKDGLEDKYDKKLDRVKNLREEDQKMIKAIKKMANENGDIQYYNSSYNKISKDKATLDKYSFNKSKNAYILIKKQREGDSYYDSYHDLNVVYKYNRVRNEQISNKKVKVIEKPLFHFECK